MNGFRNIFLGVILAIIIVVVIAWWPAIQEAMNK